MESSAIWMARDIASRRYSLLVGLIIVALPTLPDEVAGTVPMSASGNFQRFAKAKRYKDFREMYVLLWAK